MKTEILKIIMNYQKIISAEDGDQTLVIEHDCFNNLIQDLIRMFEKKQNEFDIEDMENAFAAAGMGGTFKDFINNYNQC